MLAIVAAVLFGIALLLKLVGGGGPILNVNVLLAAGLLCVALHLAGVANTVRVRGYVRRRR